MPKTVKLGGVPLQGDRILILREEWLERILNGQKDLEIRGRRLRDGDIWLGCRSTIHGKARLGLAAVIGTEQEWTALRHRHLVENPALPYKTTYGLPIQSVMRLRKPIPYEHRRGAIGIVKFRPR